MTRSNTSKEPVTQAIKEFLAFLVSEHPKISKIIIALSGGKDSIALLHALSKAFSNYMLTAVYIDHGLQKESQEWAKFNQDFCNKISVGFESVTVNIDKSEASLEQAARNARYHALAKFVDDKTCLVTAQHQSDQAETLLLQLFRGAGVKGLASMPYIKNFADGYHARPLLKVLQQSIENYIVENNLSYIEDPSNQNLNIRRNFLRKNIIPELKKEWPNLESSLQKSAENLAETQQLLDVIAECDLKESAKHDQLDIGKVTHLSKQRQNNLLRYWLASFGLQMPNKEFLQEITAQLLESSENSDPKIQIGSCQLRRYKNRIYCLTNFQNKIDKSVSWQWLVSDDYYHQQLNKTIAVDELLSSWPELKGKELIVRFRHDGDKFYKNNKSQSKSLKNYFQENEVPTWLRETALMVVYQEKVIYIKL